MVSKAEKWVSQCSRLATAKQFFFLFFWLYTISAFSQCAMCRASLESTGNNTKVEAVNDGIVFLMAIPYIIAAIIGYVIYRMYAKKNKA